MRRFARVLLTIALGMAPAGMAAQRATPDSAGSPGLQLRPLRVAFDPASSDRLADHTALEELLVVTPFGEPARAASRRSPILAGALGFIVPGAGHFYAGEPRRGLLVFGATTLGALFALTDGTPRALSTAGSVVFVGGWVFSVVDGSFAARRYNRRQQ